MKKNNNNFHRIMTVISENVLVNQKILPNKITFPNITNLERYAIKEMLRCKALQKLFYPNQLNNLNTTSHLKLNENIDEYTSIKLFRQHVK